MSSLKELYLKATDVYNKTPLTYKNNMREDWLAVIDLIRKEERRQICAWLDKNHPHSNISWATNQIRLGAHTDSPLALAAQKAYESSTNWEVVAEEVVKAYKAQEES